MVDQHAAEFPQTQKARARHKANIGNLADTRCGSSAGVDESVVARVRNLVPELRRRSEEIHALGRIPHDLFDRLLAEGLFGLSTPQSYGGLQANVRTRKATIAELGRGDLSVGWVAAVMNNAAWCLYALFPKHITDRLSATHGGFRGCVTVSSVKTPNVMHCYQTSVGFGPTIRSGSSRLTGMIRSGSRPGIRMCTKLAGRTA
ncbi:acyl-CoA dehydrogenase family protein [Bradyrhizobium sp. 521_C7_N1_3]|uniref:acyl-CoA dehydrogenase family protein n=1 Tax=Bradyrhizobium TaxID=374 RepID=UPI0034E4BBAF